MSCKAPHSFSVLLMQSHTWPWTDIFLCACIHPVQTNLPSENIIKQNHASYQFTFTATCIFFKQIIETLQYTVYHGLIKLA